MQINSLIEEIESRRKIGIINGGILIKQRFICLM
jgi:hypothetical protein